MSNELELNINLFHFIEDQIMHRGFTMNEMPQLNLLFRHHAYVATGDKSFEILEELSNALQLVSGGAKTALIKIYSAVKRQIYSEGRVVIQLV